MLTGLVLSTSVGCTEGESGGSTPDRLPHLILITADALRADHLSYAGYPRQTSPHIDEFADNATQFSQAITVIPKTGPSFTTMFTGRHPQEHGVRYNGTNIPGNLPVLAEQLKQAGYRTAAFIGNVVLRPAKGYGRGFDHYEEIPRDNTVRLTNQAFLRWAEAPWDQPTFVWIHYIDPHGPYHPPAKLEKMFEEDAWFDGSAKVPLTAPSHGVAVASGGQSARKARKVLGWIPEYQQLDGEDRRDVYTARYDAEIRLVDEAFGETLAFLKKRNLFADSAVVFTADHGESLGEHDYYFEHGWFAYDPSLRVPLVIKRPGQTEGERRDSQVSHLDFLPTVLAMLGLETRGGQGVDLFANREDRPPVLVENSDRYPQKYHGLRTPEWKYVRRESDGAEELYDLVADPAETQNLASKEPPILEQFRKQFAAARGAMQPVSTDGSSDDETLDEATREALRALGYTQEAEEN